MTAMADWMFDAVALAEAEALGDQWTAWAADALAAAGAATGAIRQIRPGGRTFLPLKLSGVEGDLSVEPGTSSWALTIDDEPLEAGDAGAEAAVLALVDALLEWATPHLGTAVWPFPDEVPEVYDTATPFRGTQPGPLLFLGATYLEAHPDAAAEAGARPTARQVASGVVVRSDGSLRQRPDDPAVAALGRRLGFCT